jgi:acyl-CoA hydrolase
MDQLHFLGGARDGQVVVLKGMVNYVGRTSMEVGVRVESEALNGDREHTASAYLTFVAVDVDGHPQEVPGLEPETDAERRRYAKARERRDERLRERRQAREREKRHGQDGD